MGERLCELAEEDEERGRLISAGEKLLRAAIYLLTAERMQGHGSPGRAELYARLQEVFHPLRPGRDEIRQFTRRQRTSPARRECENCAAWRHSSG